MTEIASPKTKKVDTEELTKRLFYQQQERSKQVEEKRQKTLKDNETRLLWSNKRLTKEDEKGMVERIYIQQMARKEQQRENHIKTLEANAKTKNNKVLTQSDMSEVVQRMYTSEVERRKAKEESLGKKYQPPPVRKTLDLEKLKEVNSRLYEETKGKKEKNKACIIR
eukprot:TRINITY_DN37713_c0_g1_i1.p1 TRINITY_DN37713_c0_g1~~TRINITY_DN37713_c0_g1_i1.p1  ORF type:complete len:177 (+),score=38.65 TRINITY_DN37713_c0_g1_i1:31-531(+)